MGWAGNMEEEEEEGLGKLSSLGLEQGKLGLRILASGTGYLTYSRQE